MNKIVICRDRGLIEWPSEAIHNPEIVNLMKWVKAYTESIYYSPSMSFQHLNKEIECKDGITYTIEVV